MSCLLVCQMAVFGGESLKFGRLERYTVKWSGLNRIVELQGDG